MSKLGKLPIISIISPEEEDKAKSSTNTDDNLSLLNDTIMINRDSNVKMRPNTLLDLNSNHFDPKLTPKERKASDFSSIQYGSFRQYSFNSIILDNNSITENELLNKKDEEVVKTIVEKSITHKKQAAILFKKNRYPEAAKEYQKVFYSNFRLLIYLILINHIQVL